MRQTRRGLRVFDCQKKKMTGKWGRKSAGDQGGEIRDEGVLRSVKNGLGDKQLV